MAISETKLADRKAARPLYSLLHKSNRFTLGRLHRTRSEPRKP